MKKLELVDSGILYINPDPAHYHVFASYSHPVQLSASSGPALHGGATANEWLATFSRGDR